MLRNSNNSSLKFERVAAVFDQVAAKVRLCESRGSEHSEAEAESTTDLSDLVNSFLENEIDFGYDFDENELGGESKCAESRTTREILENLLSDWENDEVKRSIHAEVEKIVSQIGDGVSSVEFKRRLMTRLCDRGFDSGLCKTKWEKTATCCSGNYEYVDINATGDRYIIKVFLAEEFMIARPTTRYMALLKLFPHVFIGKPDELKQVVTLMSNTMKKSMRANGIHVPPWRRFEYLQAKWFSPYTQSVHRFYAQKTYKFSEELYRK